MNNQPLPKPSQSNNNNPQQKDGGNITPPPSALNKQGVVFDGGDGKPRIPLAQKPVQDNTQQDDKKVKLPPTSLSALSSMSSNKIPDTKGGQVNQANQTGAAAKGSQANITKPVPPTTGQVKPQNTKPQTQKPQEITVKDQTSKPGNEPATKPVSNVQKTVLGAPIPQTIRGEALPKGLDSNLGAPKTAPVASSSGVAPTNVSELPTSPKTPPSNLGNTETKTAPIPVAPGSNSDKSDKDNTNSGSGKKPKFAAEKKSVLKFLPFIVGGIAILALVGFIISKIFGGGGATPLPAQKDDAAAGSTKNSEQTAKRTEVPAEQKELVYWGLWEPNEVVDQIITDFESANPGVKITYVKQSHNDYRERLQTALDSGTGPDIFRFHASWTPMLKSNLYPIPSNIISAKEFKENYYPIVTEQLVSGGQYVGVPLMYDGLALYYNEDILESASETPPSTWADLRLLAAKLTVKSADGIERAGLAIGGTSNVDHFSDILAILMLQNGADFSNPNSQETKDALLFYTNFVLKDEVWNETLPSSTVAFARGDVAMMFAPSWRAHEIAAQNPNLRFKTMTLPQLSDERIAWGSYWAEGINEDSKNKDVAAEFVSFLSSDENLMKLFSKASEIRSFGEIYPKVSMAEKLVNDGVVASYLDDAPYAQSWYLNSFTHDNGLNDQMIEYYKDGINAMLEGEDVEEVLITIEDGTKQLLKQYGISSK